MTRRCAHDSFWFFWGGVQAHPVPCNSNSNSIGAVTGGVRESLQQLLRLSYGCGSAASTLIVAVQCLVKSCWCILTVVPASIKQCYTCSYEAQKAHASHSPISRRWYSQLKGDPLSIESQTEGRHTLMRMKPTPITACV